MGLKVCFLLFIGSVGTLNAFGQNQKIGLSKSDNIENATKLFQDLKPAIYKTFCDHIALGYSDKGLKSSLKSDQVDRICQCKLISSQSLDPNDPYSTKDSSICSPIDYRNIDKIYIYSSDIAVSNNSFVLGLGFDSASVHKILFFISLKKGDSYHISDKKWDLIESFYSFCKSENRIQKKAAIMDSQSIADYAQFKFGTTR